LVAVSVREVWAAFDDRLIRLFGHLEDGVWAFWRPTPPFATTAHELTVAPDGTVWAATGAGVFSFNGVEWTRRFDGPVGAVAVGEDGTVWTFEVSQGAKVYAQGASHKSRMLASSGRTTTLDEFVREGHRVTVYYREQGGTRQLTKLRVHGVVAQS